MKKVILLGCAILLLGMGCKKSDQQLLDRITKLEQRIDVLEKRLSAAPPGQPAAQPEQTAAYDIPVGNSYVLGNPKAPLTLVEFSDFQCPFCEKAHVSFVKKLLEDPALAGKINFVFKHFPLTFHKSAKPAAYAAMAAGKQGAGCFYAMAELLYAGQRELTDENFKKWAKEIKCMKNSGAVEALNTEKFWQDYNTQGPEYDKLIKEDMDLGMNKVNVRGTPTFFLNGWKLSQRSVEAVKQLAQEKGLLAGGTPPAAKAN
jgi:protein-disulfide isomerase